MTNAGARRWLGMYFLLSTAIIGCYLLIFNGSWLLPLSSEDAASSFQIVVPVLIAQVAIMFQWLAKLNTKEKDMSNSLCLLPVWAIKAPPLLGIGIIGLAAITMAIGNNHPNSSFGVSPEEFKLALTFAVSILNVSTVILVVKLFPSSDA